MIYASSQETPSIFETLHPGVPLLLFAALVGLTMFSIHPLLIGVSFVAALIFSLVSRGGRKTIADLSWQLPLLALICVANPIFSASGITLICRIGPLKLYAESLAFGACMGVMMVASTLWLICGFAAITPDSLRGLGAGPFSTVLLLISMSAQICSQLVRRANQVMSLQEVCSASGGLRENPAQAAVRASGVLLAWALEDSLERADAMRARGWASGARRTSYRERRLRQRDLCWIVGLVALLASCAWLSAEACSSWHFYPTMPALSLWWGYLPYALLMFLPTLAYVLDYLHWKAAERRAQR